MMQNFSSLSYVSRYYDIILRVATRALKSRPYIRPTHAYRQTKTTGFGAFQHVMIRAAFVQVLVLDKVFYVIALLNLPKLWMMMTAMMT